MISPGRIERSWFWDLFEVGDCWEWQGSTSRGGYGQVRYNGQHWNVYRLVWTMLVGDIPEGMQVDHLCMNRTCANPDHLEVVEKDENLARMRKSRGRKNKRRCHRGHVQKWKKDKRGQTYCVACQTERSREHRARKAAEQE